MSETYAIRYADLGKIEQNLGRIREDLSAVHGNLSIVSENVKEAYAKIEFLSSEFQDFVQAQNRKNNLQIAHTELIRVRQELEKKYGHYDIVRRTTTGILQATDLSIVKKSTVSNASEKIMISTPGYWLAPCLVALSAWINNQPALTEKALQEGMRCNNEKTTLLFTLICRRAGRMQAALQWTQRYLSSQDPEQLDRNAVIILDAFAGGLLGADSEGIISKEINRWLAYLEDQPGFIEQQTAQWSEAINLKREPINASRYTYLAKFSKTWPILEDVMQGAMLHDKILSHFTSIFNQEESTSSLKKLLDEILKSLVCDFDDEEIPLRKEEELNQLIINFQGDTQRANSVMSAKQSAFATKKDFTQLLTDAAMNTGTSSVPLSTQKFAISLSKNWIYTAYCDITAQNEAKIPYAIEMDIDSFHATTRDGNNEAELIEKFEAHVEMEKHDALEDCTLTGLERFCLFGGIATAGIGLLAFASGHSFWGWVSGLAGLVMLVKHFVKKRNIRSMRQYIESQYAKKLLDGSQIIRAILAEVVDFRQDLAEKNEDSQKVLNFLEQIEPDQYVKKLSTTGRKILVSK